MIAAPGAETMGRKRKAAENEGKEPPTVAVKIDRALASKARMIATDKGIDLADYLTGLLRDTVERDWAKMIRRVGGEGHHQ